MHLLSTWPTVYNIPIWWVQLLPHQPMMQAFLGISAPRLLLPWPWVREVQRNTFIFISVGITLNIPNWQGPGLGY